MPNSDALFHLLSKARHYHTLLSPFAQYQSHTLSHIFFALNDNLYLIDKFFSSQCTKLFYLWLAPEDALVLKFFALEH